MLVWLVACTWGSPDAVVSASTPALTALFTGRGEGEIEPCG
jgi:hypothetical protein